MTTTETTTDTTLETAAASVAEPGAGAEAAPPAPASTAWTAHRFFEALRELSPLRVISPTGPSLFEAICSLGGFGIAGGYLNAITPEYHWHLRLDGFRHLTSKDETHARSGRRVLFFELREAGGGDPFLWIYLHRAKGEEFAPEREEAFAALHRELADGQAVEVETEVAP